MIKKISLWILAVLMLLSIAACGDKGGADAVSPAPGTGETAPGVQDTAPPQDPDPEETPGAPKAPVLIVGEDVDQNDGGEGPVYLESRYGAVYIPEGLSYQIFNVPESAEISTHDSFELRLGADGSVGGGMFLVGSKRVTSLEDCVALCISANNYGGAREDTVEEGTLSFGGLDFKAVTLQKPDGSALIHYLVAYYEIDDDAGGYIEFYDYEHGREEALRIDDPLVAELLENSTFQ
jgi:predicted small lipoprotein YifL